MERRACIELRASGGRKIAGYAAVFNSLSADLGGFVERVLPGAFARSLAAGADVVGLHHHKPELILGRTSAKTLRLVEDQRGLNFEIDLPDTQAGNDVLVGVQRGDLKGASFAFKVPTGGARWLQEGDQQVRELTEVQLLDVSITSTPAYPDTEVARRSMPVMVNDAWQLTLARRFLETV